MSNRLFVVAPFLALACGTLGCPGSGKPTEDAGTDSGTPIEDLVIQVSGTAAIHPDAVRYLQGLSLPVPKVEGLTLRVEEPLKVALNDPLGVFGSLTLPASGAFSVTPVQVDRVNLGIAAGIRDDCAADGGSCTPKVVRSATVLWDVAIENKKPDLDIVGGKAFALPVAFHDQLTQAVGPAQIHALTGNQSTLVTAGCIVGKIVDAAGAPVVGAKITPGETGLSSAFFYPTADLTSTGPSTSANGLFLFVHNGGDVRPFRFTVENHPEYLTRNAGAAKDACLVMTVYPGTVAP